MSANLSIAIKIKLIRKAQDFSITPLAEMARISPRKIMDAEKGKAEYNEKQLASLQKVLGIEDVSLTELDRAAYKERIYIMYEQTKLKNLSEAKAIRDDMAKIIKLEPCYFNLVALFRIKVASIALAEGDLKTAEEQLNFYHSCLGDLDNKNLYLYFHCKSHLASKLNNYEETLESLLKVCDLEKRNKCFLPDEVERLYYNIAACYSYLEFSYRAIAFAIKAKAVCSTNRMDVINVYLDNIIGLNYAKADEVEDAIEILDKCLIKAKSINDNFSIGITLFNLGYAYKKAEDWKTSIEYLAQASKCFEKDSRDYISSLSHKIYCTIKSRQFNQAKHMIKHAITAYGTDKLWSIYFEGCWHYLLILQL